MIIILDYLNLMHVARNLLGPVVSKAFSLNGG